MKDLILAGVEVNAATRFLVAPEQTTTVTLHTAELGTNALAWRARNVGTAAEVNLRARNEAWGRSAAWCQVSFEADGGQVYELWHEGLPDPYFTKLFQHIHIQAPVAKIEHAPAPDHRSVTG